MKNEIINKLLGEEIIQSRVMSFYIDGEMVNEILCLYVNIRGSEWFSITVSDGIAEIEELNSEPKLNPSCQQGSNFEYVVKSIDLNGRIKDIKEYLWDGQWDECAGLFFELYEGIGFSFVEENNYARIILGVDERLQSGYLLKSVR